MWQRRQKAQRGDYVSFFLHHRTAAIHTVNKSMAWVKRKKREINHASCSIIPPRKQQTNNPQTIACYSVVRRSSCHSKLYNPC